VRVTGRIVRFDDIRGYGFIAPDIGGDDVFLHANDLEIEKASARRGARVSFEIEDGPRGKFATGVQLSPDASDVSAHIVGDKDASEYYDVLSVDEFKHTLTEILLEATPTITGQQIQQVRTAFEALARKYGWIE
jgi:cold shock protein